MYETHKDSEALATGTHQGLDGASALFSKDADFKSCGIVPGVAIYNTNQGTNGLITAVTETEITDDTNSWDYGDTYEIYKTATKNSLISTIGVDKSRGWKVIEKKELNSRGWLPEDQDLDVDEDGFEIDIFGPGQPGGSNG